jgi:single-strand DNA-binding protein
VNVTFLRGRLSSPPRTIELPSGDTALTLELTIRDGEAPADTVPVAWFAPGKAAAGWEAGQELLVVGRVRRRFFRAGGRTASRTEVLATMVVPAERRATARRRVDRALADVVAGL